MKTISYILLVSFFVVTAGLVIVDKPTSLLGVIQVKIEEDGDTGIWRVRDKRNRNKGSMKVKKKDKIRWQAKGSAMEFTFSKPVDDYFIYGEGLFADGKSQKIDNRTKLKVTIREDAPSDTLVYEVYVVEADTFVVGDSPPKIIIH